MIRGGLELPYCTRCGAQLPENAQFCSDCGAPVGVPAAPRERVRPEKAEKQEKGAEDKTGPVVGGLVLILLGVTFLLAQSGLLREWVTLRNWWAYFLFGLGCILVLQGLLKSVTTTYKGPAAGSLIGGAILSVIGLFFILGEEASWRVWWPFLLIVIGLIVIISGLTVVVKRTPRPAET